MEILAKAEYGFLDASRTGYDGRWSMVDGRWSMVDGRWSMVEHAI
ncbi:hypothetical protein [Sphingomonas faeni]|nr:hypothetical protein [Sphingomonas faeni]MDQ0839095.1 hypothetical protein [Sphingomonas faeni]